MRAYLRFDPLLRRRKKPYPDGAFRAFVEVLCLAEEQSRRGRFEDERLLRVLLGPRARWLPYLKDHGDIIAAEDHPVCKDCPASGSFPGELYVDGWDEWQEGDWKVHERVQRVRNKKRKGDTPPTVTGDTPPTVSTPHSGGGGGGSGNQHSASSGGGSASHAEARTVFLGFPPQKPKKLSPEEVASLRRHATDSTDPVVRQSARDALKKSGVPLEESA